MFHVQLIPLALVCVASVCLSLLAGCELSGGAAADVSVTFKPDEAATDGGDRDGSDATVVAATGGVGTFRGRVVFQGTAPSLADLHGAGAAVKDAEICAALTVPDERLIVGPDGGVANVFVYLSKAPRGFPKSPVPVEPVYFDQKGCRFLPHAMIVRAKQTVLVLSGDPIAHNTHTFPKKNTAFNQGIPASDRSGTPMSYRSSESTPVPVKCDFHAWMSAWHLVLDHPFGAVTNENGDFEIPNIPSGEHRFQVWHEGADGFYIERNLKVPIAANVPTEMEINYPASSFSN